MTPNQNADLWRPVPRNTVIKHSDTQAQSTVAEGEKDSKSQRTMEYVVRIILLMSEATCIKFHQHACQM